MTDEKHDLYRRFEIEVRTPKRRLPVDAFLPDPSTLASIVSPPAPPPMPQEHDDLFAREPREAPEPEPEPRPRPAAKKKPVAKKKEAPKSLQDEIAEFMNRDRSLAPDEDLEGNEK